MQIIFKYFIVFISLFSFKIFPSFSINIDKEIKPLFYENKYDLKCIEDSMPSYLNFQGSTYSVKVKKEDEYSIAQDRNIWKSYVKYPPKMADLIKNWKQKDAWIESIEHTTFAKILKNSSIDLKTKNKV